MFEERRGFWHLNDQSPAEDISRALGISKNPFKRTTDSLYKQRKIVIAADSISLAPR